MSHCNLLSLNLFHILARLTFFPDWSTVWVWVCLLLPLLPRGHQLPWYKFILFITGLEQNIITQWDQASLITLTLYNRPLRVPACLAIIPHQSLKAFDWNKQLRVISQVQITLIQAHVAKAGHDWVISQPVTFITVINVSASGLWEGRSWWMEEHSVCSNFSPPSWYHRDKLSNIWH